MVRSSCHPTSRREPCVVRENAVCPCGTCIFVCVYVRVHVPKSYLFSLEDLRFQFQIWFLVSVADLLGRLHLGGAEAQPTDMRAKRVRVKHADIPLFQKPSSSITELQRRLMCSCISLTIAQPPVCSENRNRLCLALSNVEAAMFMCAIENRATIGRGSRSRPITEQLLRWFGFPNQVLLILENSAVVS